jgi:HK97 family phage major capsid protein
MFNTDTLRAQVADIDNRLRALHTGAARRALSTREQAEWDTLEAEQAELRAAIDHHEGIAARDAAVVARRSQWGGGQVDAFGTRGTRFAEQGEHRYGAWLADMQRANTVDSTTMSGKGRNPLANDTLTSWFDLIRPQSKLLDSFPWQTIQTDRIQLDVPKIKTDGPATATNEGADITGNAAFDVESILVTPAKYTSYEALSREVWMDAQPSLLDGYARGIVRRHALAWEAALVAALEATATVVATDANFATNLDVVSDAIVTMQAAGATPSGIVTTAAVAQVLLKLKEVAASTRPTLMASGPADGFAGHVFGLPLVVSSAVTATKLCVFDATQAVIVVRESPTIEVSQDALFGTDSVAVRAVSRMAAKLMNATGAMLLADAP